MTASVLVAGVGNIFFGDDGFGVEVARRLCRTRLPDHVAVVDFGIRGVHLAYELLEPYGQVIIADALGRGQPPGTVVVIEPDLEPDLGADQAVAGDAHGMCLPVVFATARSLGASLEGISIVGCEPDWMGEQLGLSPAVERAVDSAVELIRDIVSRGRIDARVSRRNAIHRR